MTHDYSNNEWNLTENEFKALMVLVEECFSNMGGSRPSDLEHDEFTWIEPSDLISKGWSKHEAAGTFSSLMEKGLIYDTEPGPKKGSARYRATIVLDTDAWKWLDQFWGPKEEEEVNA